MLTTFILKSQNAVLHVTLHLNLNNRAIMCHHHLTEEESIFMFMWNSSDDQAAKAEFSWNI